MPQHHGKVNSSWLASIRLIEKAGNNVDRLRFSMCVNRLLHSSCKAYLATYTRAKQCPIDFFPFAEGILNVLVRAYKQTGRTTDLKYVNNK